MRLNAPDAPVQWFDIQPCFVLHVGNAHEDGSGRVVLDAVRYSPREFTSLWDLLSLGAALTALISIATRRDGGASQLLVLDAADLPAGPVAAVELPRGVPTGFHGSWFPDA